MSLSWVRIFDIVSNDAFEKSNLVDVSAHPLVRGLFSIGDLVCVDSYTTAKQSNLPTQFF